MQSISCFLEILEENGEEKQVRISSVNIPRLEFKSDTFTHGSIGASGEYPTGISVPHIEFETSIEESKKITTGVRSTGIFRYKWLDEKNNERITRIEMKGFFKSEGFSIDFQKISLQKFEFHFQDFFERREDGELIDRIDEERFEIIINKRILGGGMI